MGFLLPTFHPYGIMDFPVVADVESLGIMDFSVATDV
jgi:hypothetical protein